MPLSNAQKTIADTDKRFKVAICGRRFGKTHLAIREMCKIASQPNKEVFYVAPSYRQAKQIVWKKLKRKLTDIRWIAKVNETDLSILLRNGSTIALRGADNYDSLRGVGLDYVVLDEFADIDKEVWYEVLRPALADKEGGALFIGTPKGVGNWSHDIYLMDQENDDWCSFQYTTIDGGNVSKEEIAAAKKDLDERTFRQEFLATFETYAGIIYYNFNRKDHVVKEQPTIHPNTTLHIGIDFNIDPMSAVIAIKENDKITIIDEIRIFSSNTHELIDELETRYPRIRKHVYPDPACRQRKTSAAGMTDFTILQNFGYDVKVRNKHPAVRDRINAVNSHLTNANGYHHLFVKENCKHLIECLERQCYKEGTSQPEKGEYDHMSDALGYMIDFLFPIRKDIEEREPRRWGHY